MATKSTIGGQSTTPGEDMWRGWYKDSGEVALIATDGWMEGGVGNIMIQKATETGGADRIGKIC